MRSSAAVLVALMTSALAVSIPPNVKPPGGAPRPPVSPPKGLPPKVVQDRLNQGPPKVGPRQMSGDFPPHAPVDLPIDVLARAVPPSPPAPPKAPAPPSAPAPPTDIPPKIITDRLSGAGVPKPRHVVASQSSSDCDECALASGLASGAQGRGPSVDAAHNGVLNGNSVNIGPSNHNHVSPNAQGTGPSAQVSPASSGGSDPFDAFGFNPVDNIKDGASGVVSHIKDGASQVKGKISGVKDGASSIKQSVQPPINPESITDCDDQANSSSFDPTSKLDGATSKVKGGANGVKKVVDGVRGKVGQQSAQSQGDCDGSCQGPSAAVAANVGH